MPMGPYEDFDACVSAQRAKGHDEESARKICGAMKRDLENASYPFADESQEFAQALDAALETKSYQPPDDAEGRGTLEPRRFTFRDCDGERSEECDVPRTDRYR